MGRLGQSGPSLLKEGGRLCTIWPIDRLEEWNAGHLVGFAIKQTVTFKRCGTLATKRVSLMASKPTDSEHQNRRHSLEGKATLDFTEQYLDIVRPILRDLDGSISLRARA